MFPEICIGHILAGIWPVLSQQRRIHQTKYHWGNVELFLDSDLVEATLGPKSWGKLAENSKNHPRSRMEAHPSCPGGWLPKSIGSREVTGKEKNTSPCSASETCAWVMSCWSKGRIGRTPGGSCNLMIFLGLNESFHLIFCFQGASSPGFPQVWWCGDEPFIWHWAAISTWPIHASI